MAKIVLFLGLVVFIIVFPFFIHVNISNKKLKNFEDLKIEKGIIEKYNTSLTKVISFKTLVEKDNLIYFSDVLYEDKENNYTIKAKSAVFDKNSKILKGKSYYFQTSNIKGFGKEFKKEEDIIYAKNSKFYLKE